MVALSRRAFLQAAGAAAGGALLAACTSDGRPQPPPVVGPIDPARPIERGATVRIYQWKNYLSEDVIRSFTRRHATADVDVDVRSFTTMAEAIQRLCGPNGDFDIFFPTIDALSGLVGAGVLRPLTHELLPNLANLWPFFLEADGPFYDPGLRTTVPYTVYSTGIGWRRDLVPVGESPARLANPYDAYWNARFRGAVGIYDDYREALAMAMLHRGDDPNRTEPASLTAAVDDLIAMARAVDVEVSDEGAYHELQTGEYAVQQSWSGDLLSAKRFGAVAADDAAAVAFTWPRGGIVGCDLTAICTRSKSPVLAHAFVNHLLDVGVAFENFRWNGYQPPVGDEPPTVPASLADAVLGPEDLHEGRFLRPLAPEVDARWRVGWQRFLEARTG